MKWGRGGEGLRALRGCVLQGCFWSVGGPSGDLLTGSQQIWLFSRAFVLTIV